MAIYQGNKKVANNVTFLNNQYSMPVGSIIPFGSNNIPTGYLMCDGSEVFKTDYADLYKVIGNSFGTSTDTTKFKLPDLRNRFIQGADGNLGTSKDAGLPNITGSFVPGSVPGNHARYCTGAFVGKSDTGKTVCSFVSENSSDYGFTFDASRSNSIYGKSDTVQPPALCIVYIIKAILIDDTGSGSDNNNYQKLENKPSINGVELIGNKTTADLNIVSEKASETVSGTSKMWTTVDETTSKVTLHISTE